MLLSVDLRPLLLLFFLLYNWSLCSLIGMCTGHSAVISASSAWLALFCELLSPPLFSIQICVINALTVAELHTVTSRSLFYTRGLQQTNKQTWYRCFWKDLHNSRFLFFSYPNCISDFHIIYYICFLLTGFCCSIVYNCNYIIIWALRWLVCSSKESYWN